MAVGGMVTGVARASVGAKMLPPPRKAAGQVVSGSVKQGYGEGLGCIIPKVDRPMPAGQAFAYGALTPAKMQPSTHRIAFRNMQGRLVEVNGWCSTSAPALVNGQLKLGAQVCTYRDVNGAMQTIPPASVWSVTALNQQLVPAGQVREGSTGGTTGGTSGGTGGGKPGNTAIDKANADAIIRQKFAQAGHDGLTDEQITAIIGGAGQVIGQSIRSISDAIVSGNQITIAQIQADSALAIERLRALNTPQAQAQAQDLTTLMTILNATRQPPPPPSTGISTGGWIAIAVTGVAVVGGGAYLLTRKSRKNPYDNPVMTRGKTRKFVASPDVQSQMELGFSVTGKTSSGGRRGKKRRGKKSGA